MLKRTAITGPRFEVLWHSSPPLFPRVNRACSIATPQGASRLAGRWLGLDAVARSIVRARHTHVEIRIALLHEREREHRVAAHHVGLLLRRAVAPEVHIVEAR